MPLISTEMITRTKVIGAIPRATDIVVILLFASSLFLLSPLGKPFITQRFLQTEYQPIVPQSSQPSNHTANVIQKVTYLPNGTKRTEITIGGSFSISMSVTASGQATDYSVVFKIIEVYEYIDILQSMLFLSSFYLSVRITWICAKKLRVIQHYCSVF
jgi:hypothetical protein